MGGDGVSAHPAKKATKPSCSGRFGGLADSTSRRPLKTIKQKRDHRIRPCTCDHARGPPTAGRPVCHSVGACSVASRSKSIAALPVWGRHSGWQCESSFISDVLQLNEYKHDGFCVTRWTSEEGWKVQLASASPARCARDCIRVRPRRCDDSLRRRHAMLIAALV